MLIISNTAERPAIFEKEQGWGLSSGGYRGRVWGVRTPIRPYGFFFFFFLFPFSLANSPKMNFSGPKISISFSVGGPQTPPFAPLLLSSTSKSFPSIYFAFSGKPWDPPLIKKSWIRHCSPSLSVSGEWQGEWRASGKKWQRDTSLVSHSKFTSLHFH